MPDPTIFGPNAPHQKAMSLIRPRVASAVTRLLGTTNKSPHSPAFLPSSLPQRINRSNVDIVHLHWFQREMLSIEGVASITKPLVWTLHDMWGFCGAEHYTDDTRWIAGYTKSNRPSYESGFDLNRWTWNRKKRMWNKPIQVVCPSIWLHDCAKSSALMHAWPIHCIPYPIDLEYWSPLDRDAARSLLHLPRDATVVLFGAVGGTADPRKGYDLLSKALRHLQASQANVHLVVFGPRQEMTDTTGAGYPKTFLGPLKDDISLRAAMSAADVFALPSRQDNLPLTAMESLSCGTPVVAFNVAGPPTMLRHRHNGFLASPFSTTDFANGLRWATTHPNRDALRADVRRMATTHFSESNIAAKYIKIYESSITRQDAF